MTAALPGPAEPELLPHLISISKAVRQLVGMKLADSGVAVGQDQFLLCFGKEEGLSVAGIADRLSIRASTVSKMTDILQRKGWVVRSCDDRDARKVRIHLTAAGRRRGDEVRAVETRLEDELRTAIGTDDELLPLVARLDDVLSQRLRRLR